jgi:hypothetical protein
VSSQLITVGIWKQLTRAAKKSRRPSVVAVAYFGKGASKLLPLRTGSRLVVDASEAAVKGGQTCPSELETLTQRGVRVFSIPNLHAKLFVFGNRAFIGSTNASNRSANTLVEAVVMTTDLVAARAARTFVRGLCLHELGPEAIATLKKLYKPPRITGRRSQRRKSPDTRVAPDLPKLRMTQLRLESPPDGSEESQEAGERAARSKRKLRRTHVLEDCWWTGNCPIQVGDTVVKVLTEDDGRKFVSPPGNVIHTRKWRRGRQRVTFVYLEVLNRRRILAVRLAKHLGYGAKKQLSRNGQIRNQDFAEKLLTAWER